MKDLREKLVFHMPWYQLDKKEWPLQMEQLAQWGVKEIVAPQYFYRPNDCEAPGGFPGVMAELAAKSDIKITAAHGLLGLEHDLGLAGDKELAEHRQFMRELGAVGVVTYTVHAGLHHKQFDGGRNIPASLWDNLKRSLDNLLPVAAECGMTIALENIYEPFAQTEKLVATYRAFKNPNLGLCIDVGHANISEKGLDAVFELMKNDLVTCHLHDNDGQTDQHAAPGSGIIDYHKLAAKLYQVPTLIHAETETRVFSQAIWENFLKLLAPQN